MLVALWVGELVDRLPRWRKAIRGFAFVTAALVMVAGAAIVRADLKDYRAMAAAHAVLLEEAAKVTSPFSEGGPF